MLSKTGDKELTLKTANDYINQRSLSREDLESIKSLVHEFKTSFSGFLSLVIYRQMSRITRMLDKIEEIESYIYDNILIDTLTTEQLNDLQRSLSFNTTNLIDQLTSIAANPNLKLFFDNNNGNFVEKVTQKLFHSSHVLNPELELSQNTSLDKEGRLKVQNVLSKLITKPITKS